MRRILIPAAAGLALVANAGIALAQGPERPGREGPGHAPGASQPGGMRAPAPGSGAVPNREMNTPRAASPERQGPRAETPGRVEQNRRAEPQQPNRERQRATEREQQRTGQQERSRAERQRGAEQERSRAERQRNTERERNAQRAQSAERERAAQDQKRVEDRQRKSAEQPGGPRDRQAIERNGRGDRAMTERREEIRQARTRLSAEEHRRLHSAFDLRRARVTNARFDWHPGHRVPRHVHLYPVPREVISFFPYYRDYSYFAVGEEICIVDPRSYEVVDVIDQGYPGGPRPQVAGLALNASQIGLVRDSIPPEFPEAGVRLRLALGAEIPGDVELFEFPVIVFDRIPQLRDFRFLVAAEQIVIVNPRDRSIALVIDRA